MDKVIEKLVTMKVEADPNKYDEHNTSADVEQQEINYRENIMVDLTKTDKH